MEQLSEAAYSGYSFCISIFFMLGLPLQIVNLLALLHKECLRKELTPYFMNIAIANFIFIFASFPSSFVSALQGRWAFSKTVCIVEGFFSGTSSIAMLIFLVFVIRKTNEAITKIKLTGRQEAFYGGKKMKIAFVWIFSIISMMPPLTGLTSMAPEGGGINCAPDWRPSDTKNAIYALILTVCSFFVPLILSLRYLYLIQETLTNHINLCKQNLNCVKLVIEYQRISKMIAAAIFFYIVAWAPYCIGVLISVFGGRSILSKDLGVLPTIAAKSSAVYIPIIYSAFNGRFRKLMVKVIRRSLAKVQPLANSNPAAMIKQQRNCCVPSQTLQFSIISASGSGIPYDNSSCSNKRQFERRGAIKYTL